MNHLFVSGKCLDEDTDHDDDGRNDHEATKMSLDVFLTRITLRSSSSVATVYSGRSGTLWVERSSTGTLADAWTFSKSISLIMDKAKDFLNFHFDYLHPSLSYPTR